MTCGWTDFVSHSLVDYLPAILYACLVLLSAAD